MAMVRVRATTRRRITITRPFYIDAELYDALSLLSIQMGKSISKIVEEVIDHTTIPIPINAENIEALLLEHPMVRQAIEMVRNEPDECAIAIGSRGGTSS